MKMIKVAGLICLLGAGLLPVLAEPPLPPEAQALVNQGQRAADQGAWDVAISFFNDAIDKADNDPRIYYSLGVAHDKAGHELPAAGWLQAYLIARPTAPNAAAVRQEIDRLDKLALTEQNRIFTLALETARQIPVSNIRWNRLGCIVECQAQAGDLAGAQATEAELEELSEAASHPSPGEPDNIQVMSRDYCRSVLWDYYVRYLAEVGDLDDARAALANITQAAPRMSALSYLALYQALAYPHHETIASSWLAVLGETASVPKATGDYSELAAQTFAEAESCLNSPEPNSERDYIGRVVRDLAAAYAINGQTDDCKRILIQAQKLAEENRLTDMLPAIQKALGTDQSTKNLRVIWDENPYILMASSAAVWSDHKALLDIKGQLEQAMQAKATDSSYGSAADAIALRLQQLGDEIGRSRRLLHQMARKMVFSGFQVRLLDEPVGKASRASNDQRVIFEGRNLQRLPVLTEEDIVSRTRSIDPDSHDLCMALVLTDRGQRRLGKVTTQYPGRSFVVINNGHIFSTPTIKGPMSGDLVKLTCSQAEYEANRKQSMDYQLSSCISAFLSLINDRFYGDGKGKAQLEKTMEEHKDDPAWSAQNEASVRAAFDAADCLWLDYKGGTLTLAICPGRPLDISQEERDRGQIVFSRKLDFLALSGDDTDKLTEELAAVLRQDKKWGPIFKAAGDKVFGTGSKSPNQ